MKNRQFAKFESRFVIFDDGDLSDQLLIVFSENRDEIEMLICFPECDQEIYVFDQDEVDLYHYIQAWFTAHKLFEYEKKTELFYPKLNRYDSVKITREFLDDYFGSEFLHNKKVDSQYIYNKEYIVRNR